MSFKRAVILGIASGWAWLQAAHAAPLFYQSGNTLIMSNADVKLDYNLTTGTTDFLWKNSKKISAFYSGVGLSTGYIKGINYSSWSYLVSSSNQVVVTANGAGLPTMKQYFTLDQNDSFLVRVDVSGSNLKANWMGPVVVDSNGSVDLGVTNDNRALVVPFDNDGFVRYNAMPMNSSSTGYEVAAFYDNTSRNGLVVGSVTHDVWKTGIYFSGANNKLSLMNVFGGATSPWDVAPHGSITGNVISSPTMFVGFGADWRVTMQNFAAENTNLVSRLPWTNGVPFGWNSWGVIQQNINYTDAIAVSDFFAVNLMGNNFINQGTVYINLDSYWNNLSDSQLQNFTQHCHAHNQKAGIYFGPFVWFGAATNATNTYVEGTGTNYLYSDILLRDGNGNFESTDGGLAVDPTHPGTQQRINYYINLFTNYGFNYVKLDFLSHGALEGVHYNTNVTTGIQAYNAGMQYTLNAINGRMFISESIAPLFPYQYGHSRRISCDAETSLIGNTEYVMNSVTYGWWLDGLYQFNDPDIMVFGNGADTNEAQSRLISGAVTGFFLDGDDLTSTNAQAGAQEFLTNPAMDNVARVGQTFAPVEGNTGSSAGNIFVRQDGNVWSLAVFNYTASPTNETIGLSRAGLPPGRYVVTNLWDGTTSIVAGALEVNLNEKQSKLFQLVALAPAGLSWSATNTGVWNTGVSANWLNQTNNQQVVFATGDPVFFDDTPGVPTMVSLSGTISPAAITVNSSVNNFTFSGSGTISGAGGLDKEGSSVLNFQAAGNLTGPVTIGGGILMAGSNSLDSAASFTISNGATLDFDGSTIAGNKPVTVSGTGFNGEGALYNSYTNLPFETLNVTLAGDAKFGGSSRWDLGTGAQIMGAHNLTIDWSAGAGYGEWNSVTIGATVAGITLTNGNLGMKYMDTAFQNPGTVFTVSTNCQMIFYNGGYNGSIHILNGGLAYLWTAPAPFNGSGIILDGGANWQSFYGSTDEPINSTVTLNGIAHFVLGDHNLIYTNVINGIGGFVLDYYNHAVVLSASNTYRGATIIGSSGNTPVVALTGNGSISKSSLIFFGGNDPELLHLDVVGRSDQTLTLASGQTLAGVGAVNGSLVVSPGAIISPSGTNTTIGITTGANSTGTISVSNAITLGGMTVIKLNGSGVNDGVKAGSALTYGGTLSLVTSSSSPLAAGDSFQIFTAPAINGSFTNIVPVTPGTGLAWDISHLSSGQLKVMVAPSPVISGLLVAGGKLTLSGSNGVSGAGYYVLSSTNLNLPLINWTVKATNTFDVNGRFHFTNNLVPGASQRFYRIQLK